MGGAVHAEHGCAMTAGSLRSRAFRFELCAFCRLVFARAVLTSTIGFRDLANIPASGVHWTPSSVLSVDIGNKSSRALSRSGPGDYRSWCTSPLEGSGMPTASNSSSSGPHPIFPGRTSTPCARFCCGCRARACGPSRPSSSPTAAPAITISPRAFSRPLRGAGLSRRRGLKLIAVHGCPAAFWRRSSTAA